MTRDVAVNVAAVFTSRYRKVGKPDAADRIAVMVSPNCGWIGGLELDASLRRWRRAATEPCVEAVERRAVCGCITQDVPVFSAWCTRNAVTGEKRCQRGIPRTATVGRPCHLPKPEGVGVGLTHRKEPGRLGLAIEHKSGNAEIVADPHRHRHRSQRCGINVPGSGPRTYTKIKEQEKAIEELLNRLDGIRVSPQPHRRL